MAYTREYILEQINDVTDCVNFKGESPLRDCYANKTICITGCTGFMGKCLVEKLLRGCPNIKQLYLLIRPKKQMKIEDRLKKYFDDVFFDTLRKHYPNFMDKVMGIESDLIDLNGTLKPEDRRLITETTDIIIHNGALVAFNVRINVILKVNVLGTRDLLDIANECAHLKAFVYVSTAYSHCYRKRIMEEVYSSPCDVDMVNNIIEADMATKDGLSEAAIDQLLGDWCNQYVYSKAIAEGVVEEYSKKSTFSCGIFRPSVVVSTFKEPLRGWVDNINGPVALYTATGLGTVHSFHLIDIPLDIIPADMTINALLAVPWDLMTDKKGMKKTTVYNYGSSMENPISVRDMRHVITKWGDFFRPKDAVWAYFFFPMRCIYAFWLLHILFHFFPAVIVDAYLLLRGKKAMAVPIFIKVTKHMDKFSYFANGGWQIHMRNLWKVWERMNGADKHLFYYDIQNMSWDQYFIAYWYGIQKYVLKGTMSPEEVENSRRRYLKLQILHYTFVAIMSGLFLYFVYRRMTSTCYC